MHTQHFLAHIYSTSQSAVVAAAATSIALSALPARHCSKTLIPTLALVFHCSLFMVKSLIEKVIQEAAFLCNFRLPLKRAITLHLTACQLTM